MGGWKSVNGGIKERGYITGIASEGTSTWVLVLGFFLLLLANYILDK